MSALTDRIDPYTMSGEALVLVLRQFLDGTRSCVYCKQDATVSLGTGADPKPQPMCWEHAKAFLTSTMRVGDEIWAAK